MNRLSFSCRVTAGALVLLSSLGCSTTGTVDRSPSAAGALPSWRPGPVRTAILDFVERTTDPDSPDFVPESRRLAVFDNDGTLWCEYPLYIQLAFAIDRVREMADEHPEWREEEPFRSAIDGDIPGIAASGARGVLQLVLASHAGMDTDQFSTQVATWASQARHPSLGRRFVECVYLPMIELMDLLRNRGFTVAICSGGGTVFMRVMAEELYGVEPELVVGSRGDLAYVTEGGVPRIEKLPNISFINNEEGKPVGIYERFGRRPILAVGNSDGDFEMLEWTTSGDAPGLGVLVHHTDGEREFAYDLDSQVGSLDRALDESDARGWVVVDMARDWSRIFPPTASD